MQEAAARSPYYTAHDISELVGVGRTKAYEVIAKLNEELEAKGFFTFRGKVPRKYADERLNIVREVAELGRKEVTA